MTKHGAYARRSELSDPHESLKPPFFLIGWFPKAIRSLVSAIKAVA